MNISEIPALPRKKNVSLTLTQRKSVIEESEAGESARKLGRKYNVNAKVIGSILKNKIQILEEFKGCPNPNRKRIFKSTLNDELNAEVYGFYLACRSQNVPITGPMLQKHARVVAEKLNVLNFAASNGWLHKFKTRYNISFHFSKEMKLEKTVDTSCEMEIEALDESMLKRDESQHEQNNQDVNRNESQDLDSFYNDIIEGPDYESEEDQPRSQVDLKTTVHQSFTIGDLPNVICGACLNIRPTKIRMTIAQREAFHRISDLIPLTDHLCSSCFEFLEQFAKFQKMVKNQHRMMQNIETKSPRVPEPLPKKKAASHVLCPLTGHQVFIKQETEEYSNAFEDDPCPSVYNLYPEVISSEPTKMETQRNHSRKPIANFKASIKLKPVPRLRHCDICGFSNNSKSVVMSHIKRVHLKIHRRICSICNQKYFDLKNYKRHVEMYHPNGEDNGLRVNSETNLYDCEKCGASYKDMRSMIKHSCEKGRLQLRCPECNWPCGSHEAILNHMEKLHHPKLVPFGQT